jgi:hypothetical protein
MIEHLYKKLTMNKTKLLYYISTGILTAIMLLSAGMYLFNNEMIQGAFTSLGYPTYLIYPLAIAKLLGLVAIWMRKSNSLKEWAYAGFFFDTALALTAHLVVDDGGFILSGIALVMVLVSYFSEQRLK